MITSVVHMTPSTEHKTHPHPSSSDKNPVDKTQEKVRLIIHNLNASREKSLALTTLRQTICLFHDAIAVSDSAKAIKAFESLPKPYQIQITKVVAELRGPHKISSTDTLPTALETDTITLLSSQNAVLNMQLLQHVDHLIGLEIQKRTLLKLEQLTVLLRSHSPNLQKIRDALFVLPLDLQKQLHGEIYRASPQRKETLGWGKKTLEKNPLLLIQLRHPNSSERSILGYHLQELRKRIEQQRPIDLTLVRVATVFADTTLEHKIAAPQQTSPAIESRNLQLLSAPIYEKRGAHLNGGITTFRVFAPNAKSVSVILTVFGVREHSLPMEKTPDGLWETSTPLAPAGRTYLFEVMTTEDKVMLRTDPVSFSTMHIPEVSQLQSVVVDQTKHQWHDQAWIQQREKQNPLKNPLAIYEIQAKSWMHEDRRSLTYRELAPKLVAYCKRLHFTHLELYGLLDHHNPQEHGYIISHYFAPYHALGSADDLKFLIDTLHAEGIGVILDWVPAHFNESHESEDYSFSPNEFDGSHQLGTEKSPWGTLLFDFSKEETKRFLKASALYWLDVMHVDGLRYDAVSHLLTQNKVRVEPHIEFIKELNQTIHILFPGVLIIAEDSDGFPKLTTPLSEGGVGFDLAWGMPWSYFTRQYFYEPPKNRSQHVHFAGKILHYLKTVYREARFVLTHSHDDSDKGNGQKTLHELVSHVTTPEERFSNLRNFFSWQIMAPSCGHLIHMGDELGQPASWLPRFKGGQSGVDWSVLDETSQDHTFHRGLLQCVATLNQLYLKTSSLWKQGEKGFNLVHENAKNCIIGYYREDGEGHRVFVVHNFGNDSFPEYDIPLGTSAKDPQLSKIQRVAERFNSDALEFGGSGKWENRDIKVLRTGPRPTARISIPALSTVVLEESF